jgi:isopenicillin-N N-acyltransferase like protein
LSDLPVIEASGSHYEIGFTVGQRARALIARSVANYRRVLPADGWDGSWVLPAGYLEAAREAFPHFVEELQGMADGSGIAFTDLFFLNALEEGLDQKSMLACSAIALATADEVWLGHNEDWYAGDSDTVITIHAKPKGKPAFLSVTAAPFLAAVGINEAGLAQGVNSVSSLDCRVGVPRMFAARAVLEGASIADALVLAAPAKRAGGYNHLLAHADGEIGCFETSALDRHYLPAEEITYHTNHYVSPQMLKYEQGAGKHSLARYMRLEQLRGNLSAQPDHYRALSEALSDHENRPLSICRHVEDQKDSDATIFSVIFNVKLFKIWVAVGNPCDNMFKEVKI